ncbi:winged helix-turn-helix domain-containing protein [Dietzia sp.]|uniref:winged helix-turn-helix domain-containing protein n=1 Tax=Dietzia sp. TaxID=1871616 RepID=UPI002FDA4FDD
MGDVRSANVDGGATPGSSGQRPEVRLSADEARRIALRAQGFLGAPDRRAGVRGVLRSLGAVQLDTISVLARSHELVPYARLGAVGRERVDAAYWGGEPAGGAGAASLAGATGSARAAAPHSFEYWSHAACILPIEEWPLFAFRRRAHRERTMWGRGVSEGAYHEMLTQLRDRGPLTSTELGGAKRSAEWWDWSETKIAVEAALAKGDVVCTTRHGWKRVYDLAERAVPAELRSLDLSDAECHRTLVEQAGIAMGVATRSDLADYHRLRGADVEAVVGDTRLVPVEVEGWGAGGRGTGDRGDVAQAWADPAALESAPRGRHRTTLLSPFDSLIWHRPRTARIFDFTHRLEAYTPRTKRVHGYFAMPILAGGKLVGRIDPARDGDTLVARQISLFGVRHAAKAAEALREAASWVGAADVRIDRCDDPRIADALRGELAATVSHGQN